MLLVLFTLSFLFICVIKGIAIFHPILFQFFLAISLPLLLFSTVPVRKNYFQLCSVFQLGYMCRYNKQVIDSSF